MSKEIDVHYEIAEKQSEVFGKRIMRMICQVEK